MNIFLSVAAVLAWVFGLMLLLLFLPIGVVHAAERNYEESPWCPIQSWE